MVSQSLRAGWAACAVAGALLGWEAAVFADALYEVEDPAGQTLGVFDENILADDVHIQRPAVLTRIEILLAIAAQQQCALWLFDGVKRDPLYVIPFANQPAADRYDFSFYGFDLSAEVPKDFYVGFSAQGDGWGENNSDSLYAGTNVTVGISSNYNTFFYGPVSVGQLLNPYVPAANAGFFFMTISGAYRVPAISGLSVSGDTVRLVVTNLFRGETNVVERIQSLRSNVWESSGSFVAVGDQTNWMEAVSNGANGSFYRVHVPGH